MGSISVHSKKVVSSSGTILSLNCHFHCCHWSCLWMCHCPPVSVCILVVIHFCLSWAPPWGWFPSAPWLLFLLASIAQVRQDPPCAWPYTGLTHTSHRQRLHQQSHTSCEKILSQSYTLAHTHTHTQTKIVVRWAWRQEFVRNRKCTPQPHSHSVSCKQGDQQLHGNRNMYQGVGACACVCAYVCVGGISCRFFLSCFPA